MIYELSNSAAVLLICWYTSCSLRVCHMKHWNNCREKLNTWSNIWHFWELLNLQVANWIVDRAFKPAQDNKGLWTVTLWQLLIQADEASFRIISIRYWNVETTAEECKIYHFWEFLKLYCCHFAWNCLDLQMQFRDPKSLFNLDSDVAYLRQ